MNISPESALPERCCEGSQSEKDGEKSWRVQYLDEIFLSAFSENHDRVNVVIDSVEYGSLSNDHLMHISENRSEVKKRLRNLINLL